MYRMHEAQRAWMRPVSYVSGLNSRIFGALPGALGRGTAAGWHLLHRITKEYPAPRFDLHSVQAAGAEVAMSQVAVDATPFCRLVRFERRSDDQATQRALDAQPKVLLCAPLSGHFATLLRDTVRSLAGDHDVYLTEWANARDVAPSAGEFGLDDYVLHLERFIRLLGATETHVVAVCQPAVPALAAVARLASAGEATPPTLVLMGGPIDGRISPTEVNRFATRHPLSYFEDNLIDRVPPHYAGAGRRVYPGFLQLGAFVSMNPTRHAQAYRDYWWHRARGEQERSSAHERFYDEYNAVLDMDAKFYLETVREVFQEHSLARGVWDVAGQRVLPAAIRDTALMTIEGADDDVTGRGQTHAAHDLVCAIASERRARLTVEGVGHYGIFSGSRWRESTYPQLRAFLAARTPQSADQDAERPS